MLEYDKIDINEGTDINKKMFNKRCGYYVVIGILLIKTLIIKNTCVMVVMICL